MIKIQLAETSLEAKEIAAQNNIAIDHLSLSDEHFILFINRKIIQLFLDSNEKEIELSENMLLSTIDDAGFEIEYLIRRILMLNNKKYCCLSRKEEEYPCENEITLEFYEVIGNSLERISTVDEWRTVEAEFEKELEK